MAMQISQFTLEFTYMKTNFISIEKYRPVFLYVLSTIQILLNIKLHIYMDFGRCCTCSETLNKKSVARI